MRSIVVTVSPARNAEGRHRAGARGPLFDASACLATLTGSATPLFDAARALVAEGVPPETPLVVHHAGARHDALQTTVGAAARLTVREGGDGKPRLTR